MRIVLKGKKVGRLYHLIGEIVAGHAQICNNDNVDTTLLWHLRLGHMDDRAISELNNKKLLPGITSSKLGFCKYCVFWNSAEFALQFQLT